MKVLDLSWGHPTYLSPYWDKIDLSLTEDIPTQYVIGHLPKLEKAIRALHEQEQNAVTKDKHIIVGTGATQVLSAVLRALDKPVIAHAPHFLRFPTIADQAGVPWKVCPKGYEIITNPNNPDGTVRLSDNVLKPIYDLSYNWPQYTNVLKYDEDIMIFSLAKATGHASTRIGWAVIKDPNLAHEIATIIDQLSSGVSIESQLRTIKIIKSQLGRKNTCFKYGRKVLLDRHNQLNKMKLPFKKLNHNGMFLWIEGSNVPEVLMTRHIIYMDGELLGDMFGRVRLNIGCSEKDFQEFIKRISK